MSRRDRYTWAVTLTGVACGTVAAAFEVDAPSVAAVVTLPFYAVAALTLFGSLLALLFLPTALYLVSLVSLVALVVAPLSPLLSWEAVAIERATAPLLFLVTCAGRLSIAWVLGGALAFGCVARIPPSEGNRRR